MITAPMIGILMWFAQVNAVEQATDYFGSLQEGRQALKSGHFVATGVFDANEGKTTVECWFSKDRWMIRRENSVGTWKVLVTGEFCYVQAGKSDVLLIDEDAAKKYARWFDVRIVGLGNRFALYGRPIGLEELVSIYRNGSIPMKIHKSDGDTITIKRGPFENAEAEQTIVLATKRGFVPKYILSLAPSETRSQRTTWKEMDNVFIPTKYSERLNSSDDVNIEFEWRSVNGDYATAFDQRRVFPGGTQFIRDGDGKTLLVSRPVERWWSEIKQSKESDEPSVAR